MKRRGLLPIMTLAATGLAMAIGAARADEILVASGGGALQDAQRKAYFEPTAKALGIKINEATANGLQDIRVQVDSGSVSWDLVDLDAEECSLGEKQGLFEPIDYNVVKADGVDTRMVHKDWIGQLYYSTVIAWNADTLGKNGAKPETWADFFDTDKFPGVRAIQDHPRGNLEAALLADGVAPDKLYPLDADRAFKKLAKLKPHVGVWWTSGAQSAQIAKDGEADLIQIWNGRLAAAVRDGAHAGYTYNQGLLMADCWLMPKGAPHKALAMKALAMFMSPEQQANFPKYIDYGPTNSKAFKTGILNDADIKRVNSSPENAAKQVIVDDAWWGEHGAQMIERWQNFKQQ
jgi:putative spermidine/putrescine transport system substrate-binding protein